MNDWNFEEDWMPRHRFSHRQHRTRPILLKRTVLTINTEYKIVQLRDHAEQDVDEPYLSITTELKETKVYTIDEILKRVKKELPLKEYLIVEKFFMERSV